MKTILSFCLIVISINAFGQTKPYRDSIVSISYYSYGMTGYFSLQIDSARCTYEEVFQLSGIEEKVKSFIARTSAYEWSNFTSSIKNIDMNKLSELEAPTINRHTDRALYARLTIKTIGGTFQTQNFDERRPMKEIWSLLYQINNFINRPLIDCDYQNPHK